MTEKTRPHLIKELSSRQGSAARTNARIIHGDFFADVLLDAKRNPPITIWIVQKTGSPEVLHWGQEHTFIEAESCARQYLEGLSKKEQKSGT